MRVKYIAWDDTEFDNLDDCVQYEKSFEILSKSIRFFNLNGQELKNFPPHFKLEDKMEDGTVYFTYVPSDKARDFLYDNFGYTLSVGINYYDYDEDCYKNLEETVEDKQREYENACEALEAVMLNL